MSDLAEARALAMALPEVTEQDHHSMNSFRVRGKIFATVPDDEHIRIMVDEAEIHAAIAENPSVCGPFYWGSRLACVVVALSPAPGELLRELLTDAWLRKAPKALARDFAGYDGKAAAMADEQSEIDVDTDPARVDSRATGGVPDPTKADQASTTGTTPDAEYVGRTAGEDVGYAEEQGAERRAETR